MTIGMNYHSAEALIGRCLWLTPEERDAMLRTFVEIRLLPGTEECPDIERDKWRFA